MRTINNDFKIYSYTTPCNNILKRNKRIKMIRHTLVMCNKSFRYRFRDSDLLGSRKPGWILRRKEDFEKKAFSFGYMECDVSVNVLPESDRRCLPTSASDCPDSKREKDDAARAVPASPGSPDRYPPRRELDSTTTTEQEEVANAADRTRDSANGPQGRRPNPRTTPQLLATKVASCCSHARIALRARSLSVALNFSRFDHRAGKQLACLLHMIFAFVCFVK